MAWRREWEQRNQGIGENGNRGREDCQRVLQEAQEEAQNRSGRKAAAELAAAYTREIVELPREQKWTGQHRGARAPRLRPSSSHCTQQQEVFLELDRSGVKRIDRMLCLTTALEGRSCFRSAQDREGRSAGAVARFGATVGWRMATSFDRRMQDAIALLRGLWRALLELVVLNCSEYREGNNLQCVMPVARRQATMDENAVVAAGGGTTTDERATILLEGVFVMNQVKRTDSLFYI